MIKNFPVKTICVVVLLLFVVWLWQSKSHNDEKSDEPLTSAISAVSDAQASNESSQTSSQQALLIVDDQLDEAAANRLRKAAQLIEQGQSETAVSELQAIIQSQPNAIEPYINLAALYAKSKKIDLARDTLLSGIEVNKNTAVLFDSLQKVYAAQASLAYQRALEIETVGDEALAVNLPIIDTLSLNLPSAKEVSLKNETNALSQRIAELEKQQIRLDADLESLAQEKQILRLANDNLKQQSQVAESAAIKELESNNQLLLARVTQAEEEQDQLKQNMQSLEDDKTRLSLENQGLKQQIDTQKGQQLATVSLKSQQNQARLKQQLSESNAKLTEIEQRYREQIAQLEEQTSTKIETLQKQLAAATSNVNTAVASVQLNSRIEAKSEPALSLEPQTDKAINLVKSWANQWAAQNVPAYINHYVENFTPSSGLSHSQWREQRRVRLTNKSFIEVDVSNFSVQDQDDKFAVTFMQHYRSNNVDDRIQKRLVFVKQGGDWSNAKIVSEVVTSR